MFIYAQVDPETNLCVGVSRLSGEVNDPCMKLIPDFDPDLLGQQWDGEKFVFAE